MKTAPLELEKQYTKEGYSRIAGVDEAGRGPLAGPVVAAAVILSPQMSITGLNDSKQLKHSDRERLFVRIQQYAEVGVGIVSEVEIDSINIFQASRKAMLAAVDQLTPAPQLLLVDGRMGIGRPMMPAMDLIKGDQRSASIAAASIVAKVVRDQIMQAYHAVDARYAFDKHKGYGTRRHLTAIIQHGGSNYHRRSFRPFRQLDQAPQEIPGV